MRKFIRKKAAPFTVGEPDSTEFSAEPPNRATRDDWHQRSDELQSKLATLQLENQKLKTATQNLLEENIRLKVPELNFVDATIQLQ